MNAAQRPHPSTSYGIKGFVPPDTAPKPTVVEPEWLNPAQPNLQMQFLAGLMKAWGLTIDDLKRALVNQGVDLLLEAARQMRLAERRENGRAMKRAAQEYIRGRS